MDRRSRTVAAVCGLTALALIARLVALGGRPFHWEEGRVGYWALRFAETGAYRYRPVAGGPFVHLADRLVFALLGVSDATARLPVALAGGLSPLAALLFRGPLDDGETTALAGVLALDPLVVYYGRFLRGDVPAAVFGLVVVGAVVRYRREGGRWLSVAGLAAALALAASTLTLVYPFVWLAAAAVTLDEARIRGAPDTARRAVADGGRRVAAVVVPAVRAGLVFLFAGFVLFAPRSAGVGPGLWDPTTWPAVADAAFAGTATDFFRFRVVYRLQPGTPGRHALVPYLRDIVRPLAAVSFATLAAAVVGFFSERYGAERRPVVAFAGYTVVVGLFLIAIAAWTAGPWLGVHLVVFAAVPAAVGITRVARGLRRRVRGAESGRVALALALVAGAVAVAAVPVAGVYAPPERGSPYTQYAQPTSDVEGRLPALAAAMDAATGPDVVYVGTRFDTSREYARPPIAAVDRRPWGARFPLPWYVERLDAGVTSVPDAGSVPADPAVVVTTPGRADSVAGRLGDGYERVELQLATYRRPVVVFYHDG